eukprot:Em0014g796a
MDANGWTEIACGSNDRKSIQLVVTQVLEEAGIPVKRETIVPAASLESGGSLLEANPHDVAGLLKQYIRELPEPLTTRLLSPTFERCQHLSNSCDYYTLLACLLLPEENIRMLKVLMGLLAMVADDYKHSLMSCASLAIVMAPNFTESLQPARRGGGRGGGETNLKEYTAVLEALILNAGLIGLIPKSVLSKAVTGQRPDECGNRGNISGNVLSPRYQKKKRRSASFSGIVEGLSHRLKGKAFDTQTDESSYGPVLNGEVDVPVGWGGGSDGPVLNGEVDVPVGWGGGSDGPVLNGEVDVPVGWGGGSDGPVLNGEVDVPACPSTYRSCASQRSEDVLSEQVQAVQNRPRNQRRCADPGKQAPLCADGCREEELRASLSYPDLTPSSRRCRAPAPPPSETTPYKCGLKHSASVDSGSVKRPSGMGMGRGPTAPTARLAIRDVCQQKLLPAGTTATLQHTTARQCRKVSLEGEGDGPGDLSTLPHSPEMLERIGEEMRERQQCYLYDSSYSNGIQKMNTSYCHAVSNRSSSSSSSFGAHGDRRLPSTPSHFGGTPLGGVFKMADRLMTPGSLLRCKRKPDGQPFLSALTPSWKRARKEGHRDGEEETEKLSKRAQLYLVQERTADEGVGKENVSSEPIASPVTAQASNKGPHVREWIV